MDTFSMNVIAQTLSSHTEMIAPGVMGINFMKPEKPINTMSEVYKLVQEEEQNKVRSPTPTSGGGQPIFRPSKIPPSVAPKPVFNSAPSPVQNQAPPPPAPAPAPAPKPALRPMAPPAPEGPSQGPCSDCGRNIVGPFVSLSDRTLHQDCFNCSTCGTTLQNVGFHNINNKLYCETHAKLAARVIATNAASAVSPTPPFAPAPAPAPQPIQAPAAPLPKPIQDLPRTFPLAPQAPVVPPLPQSSIPMSVPTPYGQNLINLPHTPSSSGNLAFRSISPQPFKRVSGEFHRVTAPCSPTPGSAPSAPLAYSSGPLPFEMTPYMPPDQSRSSLFSTVSESSQQSSEISSQTTQVSQQMSQQVTQQVVQQRTTQVTQQQMSQSSVYSMDYKQVVAGQSKTKFVWPPPKSEFELDGSAQPSLTTSAPQTQNYSPLATQSTPQQDTTPAFRSVQGPLPSSQPQQQQELPAAVPAAPAAFTVPPLPSTFPTEPPKAQDAAPAPHAPAPMPIPVSIPPPPAPKPTPSISGAFAPVLPPIMDTKPASAAPLQPGVPTGAGSKPAPKKGRGQLMSENVPGRIPICGDCGEPIRGPFIIALNRTWCPDHFHCNNLHCKTPLLDVGFVEEQGQLYCEACYEQFLAPVCNKCNVRIKGDCLNALDRQWHPECFICGYCNKPFGNNSFYLEDGLPYCEKDWNELFTTKCISCGFPIEAGDRWVEALNNNYHSQCFKCSVCQKNLEGQSFYAKGGKPYCKAHAR